MIAKDELLKIPQLAKEIASDADRIEAMRSALTSPKGFDSREKVQTSGSQDSALVDVIIDLEQQLDEKRGMLSVLKRQAQAAINMTGLTGDDSILMQLRYVHVYSWETVEQLMHYSRATVFRRHSEVLKIMYGEASNNETQ